jgi:VanZ family protein
MGPSVESSVAGAGWPLRLLRWAGRRRLVLGLLAVATVFALSSIPNTHPPRIHGLDKAQHIVEYFALGLLFLNVATRGLSRVRPLALAGAWLASIAVSLADESYQRWIPGRSFDLWDVAASATGSLAALGTVLLAYAVLARPLRGGP